jgi:hypothetical protein
MTPAELDAVEKAVELLRAPGATVLGVYRAMKLGPKGWAKLCENYGVRRAIEEIEREKRSDKRNAKIAANLEAIEQARAKFAKTDFVGSFANEIRDAEREAEAAMRKPLRSLAAMGVKLP